jgi:hypothetical protein
MAIQNLFTSRDNNLDGNTYVGQFGRLWYNPDTNSLYASNGVTVGGIPVDLATNANILANNLTVTQITSTTGTVTVTGNLAITGNISPATDTKIGGVRAGPGANIGNDGLLTIDTTGLPLSFGNFTANNNILTLVNVNEDMILETSGNAEIQLIGNIGFYKSNGGGVPDPDAKFFFAQDDGQIMILVPAEDPFLGAVEIIGSSTGNIIPPGASGTMLQITGNPGIPTRLYMDGNGEYASFVGRRYNGNVAAPTQVLAGQDVLRINATAATNAGGGNVGNVAFAQVRMTALENQTATAQGSQMVFTVTPVGQPATNRVDVANITVANGVTATQFTTIGNVVANNVVATGAVTSNSKTAGIGYRSGAGDVVTQLTSKSTPVTLNAVTGEITMNSAQLGGDSTVSFVLNNTVIANTDVMIVNQVSDANIGFYSFNSKCNSGNALISVHNMTNTNRSDAIVLRFVVIRGAVN